MNPLVEAFGTQGTVKRPLNRIERFSMALVTRLLVWITLRHVSEDVMQDVRIAVEREVAYLPSDVIEAFEYGKAEANRIAERLARLYDIGPAMNEATNRAIVQKKKKEQEAEGFGLTDKQKLALQYQQQYLAGLMRH